RPGAFLRHRRPWTGRAVGEAGFGELVDSGGEGGHRDGRSDEPGAGCPGVEASVSDGGRTVTSARSGGIAPLPSTSTANNRGHALHVISMFVPIGCESHQPCT